MNDDVERRLNDGEANLEERTKNCKLKLIEEGFNLVIPTRYKPESIDLSKFNLSVSYSFSSGVRRNIFKSETGKSRKYGADAMTYRRLYIILCECFNGGELFVDTYFDTLFESHMGKKARKLSNLIKRSFDEYHNLYDEALAAAKWRKDGLMKKSSRGYRLWEALQSWRPIALSPALRAFSLEVKEDISCSRSSDFSRPAFWTANSSSSSEGFCKRIGCYGVWVS